MLSSSRLVYLATAVLASSSLASKATSSFPNPLASTDNASKCNADGETPACDPEGYLAKEEMEQVKHALHAASFKGEDKETENSAESKHKNEQTVQDEESSSKAPAADEKCRGVQMAAVITSNLEAGRTPQESCKAVLDAWGVGDAECNNGVVIFLAIKARQLHICTGKGAMGGRNRITDTFIDKLVARAKPLLKEQEYPKAIESICGGVRRRVWGSSTTVHDYDSGLSHEDDEATGEGGDWGWVIAFGVWVLLVLWKYLRHFMGWAQDSYTLCKNRLSNLQRKTAEAKAKK